MTQSTTERLFAIQRALLEILEGKFERRVEVSEAQDEIDAIATGINVVVDELSYELEEQRQLRLEIPRIGRRGRGSDSRSGYGVVKKAGGAIRIDSEPGRGTKVTVLLPRDGPPSIEDEAQERPPTLERSRSQAKILVVED